MKVSEAIDQLEIRDTVWAKATVNAINFEGGYIRAENTKTSIYLDGNAEISLTEPQAEKVEVSQEFADWIESVKEDYGNWQSWCVKEVAGMGWGNWLHANRNELDNLPHDGWADEVFRDKEKHIKAIYDGYTVKPKRWVVRHKEGKFFEKFTGNGTSRAWVVWKNQAYIFTNRAKAEAVATLVEGSVEEV